MKIIRSTKQIVHIMRDLRQDGRQIGYVPTMGYLHEGHLSLMRYAKKQNDIVVVSIFVNPTQFGPKEDFKSYPRDLKRDKRLLSSERVNYLFLPSKSSIYPKEFRNYIDPGPLARALCGAKRPGHFRGVATVVNRLFEIVQPNRAYFGMKDYQQVKVVQDMIRRTNSKVKIKSCPIVREKDGLAMSSRNRYLSKKERIRARVLFQSLTAAKIMIQKGESSPPRVKKLIRAILQQRVDRIDYIELMNPEKLTPLKRLKPPVLIALACFMGSTRLIDNLVVKR